MRRKTSPTKSFLRARDARALAPSTRRCALPSVRALLAVGASLLAGGATTIACKGKEDVSPDPRPSIASSSSASSSAGDLATSAPASTTNEAPSSASASASVIAAAASCSASAHVVPHIAPSKDNHMLGGKPMPVSTKKCPPGEPLCDL